MSQRVSRRGSKFIYGLPALNKWFTLCVWKEELFGISRFALSLTLGMFAHAKWTAVQLGAACGDTLDMPNHVTTHDTIHVTGIFVFLCFASNALLKLPSCCTSTCSCPSRCGLLVLNDGLESVQGAFIQSLKGWFTQNWTFTHFLLTTLSSWWYFLIHVTVSKRERIPPNGPWYCSCGVFQVFGRHSSLIWLGKATLTPCCVPFWLMRAHMEATVDILAENMVFTLQNWTATCSRSAWMTPHERNRDRVLSFCLRFLMVRWITTCHQSLHFQGSE